MRAKISALGRYVPPRLLTNFDLEKLVETSNQWILERTGIVQRHIVDPGMATSDLAVEAARRCLAMRGMDAKDVEVILVASVTPDHMFPATACLVQDRLGAKGAWGFDISAACSGFIYALATGTQFIATGMHKRVLVIGADVMSSIIDYTDRATCILFGDGAGAVLLEPTGPSDNPNEGVLDFLNEVDGSGGHFLHQPGGGSRNPASAETVAKRMHYVHQDGGQVFKFAVRKMHEVSATILERNGLTVKDVDLMLPHQANRRIITSSAERLGLDCDKVLINIDRYGNTTAGTIPLAMGQAMDEGKLKKGSLALLAAVGAGSTVGAALVRWSFDGPVPPAE
jgi:3-oxoacyl-[acyl-carrier-protein] synthase-3